MPQTKEVEEFLRNIAPFFEIIEEDGEPDNGEKTVQEMKSSETITSGSRAIQTLNKEHKEETTRKAIEVTVSDSDDDIEYEDSYDDLPDRTPIVVSVMITK